MPAKHVDIHKEMVESGAEIDHHESDLYVRATPEVLEIAHKSGWNWGTFVSQIDGKLWVEIPFGYWPFWERRGGVK